MSWGRTWETVTLEKVDRRDGGPNVNVEETAGTTTHVNGEHFRPKSRSARALPLFLDHRLSSQTQAVPKLIPSLRHRGRRVRSSDTHVMCAGKYLRRAGMSDGTRTVTTQREAPGVDVHFVDEFRRGGFLFYFIGHSLIRPL